MCSDFAHLRPAWQPPDTESLAGMQAAKLREAAREGKLLESSALDEVTAEVAAGPSEKQLEDGRPGT